MVATVLIFAGIVTGSYLTVTELILPKVFALNDTTKTWTFNTANAGDYTYDSNLVTVDDNGARPVTGVNKLTNPDFASDNTSWSVGAIAPTGWVEVPGNSEFYEGDYNGNFLLMKYEAKAWDTQTSSVIADGGYGSGASWAGTNSQTRYEACSLADGRPWVYITQNHTTNFDAREACSALGSDDYHLVNNNEWITVARNATQIGANWTNGVVGSGMLPRGHSDNAPASSLVASTDDSEAWYGMTGDNFERDYNKRTLTLSNGEIVWDLAGNVWNWTNDIQSEAINTTAGWVEWNHANVAAGAIDLYGPPDGYLSAQGMGQIYGGALNNAFLRGGR